MKPINCWVLLPEETYTKYGYYPSDLPRSSHKRVIVECCRCGEQYPKNYHNVLYHPNTGCMSCGRTSSQSFSMLRTSINGPTKTQCKKCHTHKAFCVDAICQECRREFNYYKRQMGARFSEAAI